MTEEDNKKLMKEPTLEEIKEAVFSMNPNSAAGPDGFCGVFYQSCWEVTKEDFCSIMKSFFAGKALTKAITSTSITLIPKTVNPFSISYFRPISLINFCRKIITKMMVLRLADILSRIISPSQIGFVKGRSITDNILLAQEMYVPWHDSLK